jgi:hypothetical protein
MNLLNTYTILVAGRTTSHSPCPIILRDYAQPQHTKINKNKNKNKILFLKNTREVDMPPFQIIGSNIF